MTLQHYQSLFDEATLPGDSTPWIKQLRKTALDHFLQTGFPTKQNEDWRYTSLKPFSEILFKLNSKQIIPSEDLIKSMLKRASFAHPREAVIASAKRAAIQSAPLDCRVVLRTPRNDGLTEVNVIELVFINGEFFPTDSYAQLKNPSVKIAPLETLLNHDPKNLADFFEPSKQSENKTHPFTMLNNAFMKNGAFIEVAENQQAMIHLIFLTAPEQHLLATHLRNLIVLQKNATATIIETYLGENDTCYLTNTVTQAFLHENATLTHCKIQNESKKSFHFGTTYANQVATKSEFTSHVISLGGLLSRSDTHVALKAPITDCTLNGLYQLSHDQHMDHYTSIDHQHPQGASREFYKGTLDGKSQGVFNGKILVRQDAQKTDSKQYNQNLLLSEQAEIDTKPQLEIFADDVKCAHGSTVGQLDETALFYLRSRGLDEPTAKHLLVNAFFSDILDRISQPILKEHIQQCL